MDKELIDYIKKLSQKDKKTLSQKALKCSEETGELAKVILPFDNAHGTTHRFVEKERILEESVDVILTALSMAYDIGFSHDDIEEMMWRKAQKWHGIQVKEDKVEYPIPYEIHVTVNVVNDMQIKMFNELCNKIGVKPIVLDLENSGKSVMRDVMTSSHHMGNNVSAYTNSKNIEAVLLQNGFNVVRVKIETVPWHPAAPVNEGDKMPKDCYFEAHIGCIITPEEKGILEAIASSNNAHLSRNYFKKLEDGKFVNMLTLRHKEGVLNTFNSKLEEIRRLLDYWKIDYEKVITEFSIYDTKISHDFIWTEKMNINQ
jgi:NTP pyrophosphatase (non-canonical NTP hydrolase)